MGRSRWSCPQLNALAALARYVVCILSDVDVKGEPSRGASDHANLSSRAKSSTTSSPPRDRFSNNSYWRSPVRGRGGRILEILWIKFLNTLYLFSFSFLIIEQVLSALMCWWYCKETDLFQRVGMSGQSQAKKQPSPTMRRRYGKFGDNHCKEKIGRTLISPMTLILLTQHYLKG